MPEYDDMARNVLPRKPTSSGSYRGEGTRGSDVQTGNGNGGDIQRNSPPHFTSKGEPPREPENNSHKNGMQSIAAKEGAENSSKATEASGKLKEIEEAARRSADAALEHVTANPAAGVADKAAAVTMKTGKAGLSVLKAGGSAVTSAVSSSASAVLGGVKSMGAGIAHGAAAAWGGITSSVATAAAASAVMLSVVGGVSAAGSVTTNHNAILSEGYQENCREKVEISFESPSGNELYYAQRLYSALTVAGASKQEAAGMLGNFSMESGIDPTSVETIFASHGERYTIGPMKEKAMHASEHGFDRDFHPDSGSDPGYGAKYPRIYRLGIGLGQWTDISDGSGGGRNTNLREFAKAAGKEWYDMDVQIAFLLHEDRSGIREHYIGSGMSLDEATAWFMHKWEGISNGTLEARQEQAARLILELDAMQVDRAYGESVLKMAGISGQEGGEEAARKAKEGCAVEKKKYFSDNEGIADAAASIAWPTIEQSRGNNGTEVLQSVARQVNIPGHLGYTYPLASCDVTAAIAIRWSGADDNFPYTGTATQKAYLDANPDKWVQAGHAKQLGLKGLKPGDILIASPNHVVIYVGRDAAKKAHPESSENQVEVSGSLNDRSAGLTIAYALTDDQDYVVYRNVSPEPDSIYKNVKP